MVGRLLSLALACSLGCVALATSQAQASDVPSELRQDKGSGRVARQNIIVSGSDAMTPFTTRIFQHLSASAQIVVPELQPVGTHAGFHKFCGGIGVEFPDIVAATRRMRQSEFDDCIAHTIADIIEIPIGYSALALVARREDAQIKLTPKTLYQAIVAELPVGQEMVVNPYRAWNQIDAKLPKADIRVILPAAAAGTRNFFDDMFMQGGCRKFSMIRNIYDDTDRVRMCVTARKDDRVIEIPVNYDDILPKLLLQSPPGTIGILPYFVAIAHRDTLQILPVNDVMPNAASMVDDSYEGVHTLYYYLKRAHMRDVQGNGVVRGLRQFIIETTSEAARGPEGYLVELGVVPLPADLRANERRSALRLERFTR